MARLCHRRTPVRSWNVDSVAGILTHLQSTYLAGEGGAQNMHDRRFSHGNDLGDHDV